MGRSDKHSILLWRLADAQHTQEWAGLSQGVDERTMAPCWNSGSPKKPHARTGPSSQRRPAIRCGGRYG